MTEEAIILNTIVLNIAVKTMNDTADPSTPVSALLVIETLLHIPVQSSAFSAQNKKNETFAQSRKEEMIAILRYAGLHTGLICSFCSSTQTVLTRWWGLDLQRTDG